MRSFTLLASLMILSCAGTPISTDPVDWQGTDEDWSIHIVTLDPDGSERSTRIWLATLDGSGAFRTGDSRWWRNLQRAPNGYLRTNGHDYPVQAQLVADDADKVRIDKAFAAKYGWQERLLFSQERGETHENYGYLHDRYH